MEDRVELLAQVASMYYEDNLTQDEIARRISTSRSTVSRMIHEAREAGVVEITVHYAWKTVPELEEALVSCFRLRRALVLRATDQSYSEVLKGLGQLAARHLKCALADGRLLGISWGAAVHSTVRALRPDHRPSITVVQMVGAVGEGDPSIDGPELTRTLASVL